MRSHQDLYLAYESRRDVLFIFGAGTSASHGMPLQRDILPLLFESNDEGLRNSVPAQQVREFLTENFYIKDQYPSLESVFGFMDFFISRQESLSAKYDKSVISQLRECLVLLIHHIVGMTKVDSRGIYRSFWERVGATNRNVAVLSMNYDTLLEESFDFLYPDVAYIDYCIDLMNYHHYEELNAFDWW